MHLAVLDQRECTKVSRTPAQRLGPVDHEEVLTVGGQTVIAQMGQQALDAGCILRCAGLDPHDVFLAVRVHAHCAEHVMGAETLPIDIDDQDRNAFPAPFLKA